jgi:hypothetical protein
VRTGDALSARQAETIGRVARELQGSPDIARQGEMERWEPGASLGAGRWVRCRFVLTRAGFLHWFAPGPPGGGGDGGKVPGGWGRPMPMPVDHLSLVRCAFEQGAPLPLWAAGSAAA